MAHPPTGPITQLLAAVSQGDSDARQELWSLVYHELHRVAERQMVDESPGRTLQPTALLHEVYLRLLGSENCPWVNRRHFFAAASRAMRCYRIDDARRRKRRKREGSRKREQLYVEAGVFDQDPAEVLAVNEALDQLEKIDARKAEIVMMRYFSGLSIDDTAEALGLSPRTVDSDWRFARIWLHRALVGDRWGAGESSWA